MRIKKKKIEGEIRSLLKLAGHLRDNLKEAKDIQLAGNVSAIELKVNQEVEKVIESQFKDTLDQLDKKQKELVLLEAGEVELEVSQDKQVMNVEVLEKENQALRAELAEWKAKSARQSTELVDGSKALELIVNERDDLRRTCDQLQASIQELAIQRKRQEARFEEVIAVRGGESENESNIVGLRAFSEKDETARTKPINIEPIRKMLNRGGKLDVDGELAEDSSIEKTDFAPLRAENLFESRTKEFRPSRNIEDVQAQQQAEYEQKKSEERAKIYEDCLEHGDTEEDVALSIAKELVLADQAKRRVYS